MTRVALLLEKLHSRADAILTDAGIEVRRVDQALTGDELVDALDGVQLLGIRSKSRVTADVLDRATSLEAIGCFCIGTNQVDLDAARASASPVFNAPFANTRSVAEMTIAEVISLLRRLFDRSMGIHQGTWSKSAEHSHEIRGRTLGIIGYGHIGSQVSVLAEALGMRVIYFDVIPKLPLGNARPVASLSDLLAESDVVTLHVPATETTRNLVNASIIEQMKPGAMLINNARGSVVDLDALGLAIREGRLGGAALDVFPEEPASNQDSFACSLAGTPNCILTPHVGGSTQEAQESIAVEVADKLVRFAQTGTTSTAVNVPEVDLPHTREGQLRILHFHRNVPGVLSKMHSVMAELGVNINAEYLQSHGDVSYVIVDLDPHDGDEVLARMAEIPETLRVRAIRG